MYRGYIDSDFVRQNCRLWQDMLTFYSESNLNSLNKKILHTIKVEFKAILHLFFNRIRMIAVKSELLRKSKLYRSINENTKKF